MSSFDGTLFRAAAGPGLHVVQERTGGGDGARELSSWRLHLGPGDARSFRRPGEETALVLQQGTGTLRVGDQSWTVARRGVFAEPATALYLPPDATLEASSDDGLEAVLVSTPVPEPTGPSRSPWLASPGDVEILQRGSGPFEREIHNIFLTDDRFQRLLVGETFNPPGKWSSYPPHKHDGRDGEPRLEEVYHYRLEPPQGFGLQVLYDLGGGEVVHRVGDRDAVLLPHGFHPVAAAPGYRLCYLWVLSGEQRQLALFEDPAHAWTHELPEGHR